MNVMQLWLEEKTMHINLLVINHLSRPDFQQAALENYQGKQIRYKN
jgi:hypothetical protein